MLSPRLLTILKDYWLIQRPRPYLFLNRGDQPITRHAVEAACQKARAASGIAKPITPHSMRHYAAFRTMPSRLPMNALYPINEGGSANSSQTRTRHSLGCLITGP